MRTAFIILVCLTLGGSETRADDDELTDESISPLADANEEDLAEEVREFDYSRFSDGPRRVPTPRGASKIRAEALGLGNRLTASRLLHGRPEARWVEAARGSMPEHLRWPVERGRFGRGFGYVRVSRPGLRHNGVDVVAEEGSVVRAVADGIVAYSDNEIRGFGNMVMIVHPNGWVSIYAHNYRTTVQPGWHVRRGERIAFVGSTGISRGPHLHFELRVNGHPRDPLGEFEGRPWIAAYRRWRDERREGRVPELSAHLQDDLPPDRPTVAVASTPASSSAVDDVDLGSAAHVRRLLREGARPADLEGIEGRHFRNALWPVRGGQRARVEGRGLNIYADDGAPIRAIADGVVVFAGEGLRGLGRAVAILHPNGWVSLYGSNREVHVEVGQPIQRGEWIARMGDHLHVQVRHAEASLPDLLVQVPDTIRL